MLLSAEKLSPLETSMWAFSGEQHTLKVSWAMFQPSGRTLNTVSSRRSCGACGRPRDSTSTQLEKWRMILLQPFSLQLPSFQKCSPGSSEEASSNPDGSHWYEPEAARGGGWDCILYQVHQKSHLKLTTRPEHCSVNQTRRPLDWGGSKVLAAYLSKRKSKPANASRL